MSITTPFVRRLLFTLVLLTISALNVLPQRTFKSVSDRIPEEVVEKSDIDEAYGEVSASVMSSSLISATTYLFSSANGVLLEDMSSGTTQLVGPGVDDTASAVTNIGFDFWYDGVRHSQFSVNANGLARLGSTVIGTTFDNSANGLGTTVNAPKIAPYFEDLCVGSNGRVHFRVVGTAPSRRLVVEWQNMEIPRNGSCAVATEIGVFQMWLFESAATSDAGRIQFVYGAGVNPSTTDLGASVGLQAGAATNFASVTVSDDTVSYTVANNTNLPGIPSGKSYVFTPNIPVAPTNLTFGPVTQLSIQLNWTDNASNEVGYAIYRSTDGTNFSFVSQTAADAVLFNDTSLLPGTTYFYRVHAVTDGALSGGLTGSQATNAAGSDSCAGAGGNWSNTATWTDGSVPTGADNVSVGAGCTVTVDVTTAVALGLTVQSGGTVQFIDSTASTLTVTQNVNVAAGGTIQSAATLTTTTHLLSVGGNLANNGTLDFSTNADTAGAELRFTGDSNTSFTGTGTNDLRLLTISKGTGTVNPTSPTLDVNLSNMTVRGLSTGGVGFLNTAVFNGIVRFSGTNTFGNPVFQVAGYSIPTTGGFWLNNPNFTVAGQNGSPTMNGLLRITDGTFNVGTASGNSMGGGTGAIFTFEGGTSNFAGRLQTLSAIMYNQSGGTVNVCTVGNTATTACFGLTSATNTFNMTGGTIVLVSPNTNAAPLDYSVSSTAVFLANPAGTVLSVGTGAAAQTFRVLGATPNILIPSTSTMNVGGGTAGGVIFMRGSTVTNNGAIAVQGTGTSSRFDWAANGPMTYGGTGTFGTAATSFAGVGMSSNGNNTTINSPIVINRINFFTGGFINSGNITLGNGGISATVIQVGNNAAPTNAGVFDVSPVHNSGSGGHTVLNLRTTTLNRSTGFEINPTRTLAAWTIDDNAVGGTLTISGGSITTTGALTLTNGIVVTGPATLTHNGAATRTAGRVNGNLRRSFAAAGAYTFHVGTANGYSPVAANVTAGTFPAFFSVTAFQAPQPNIPTPSLALSRYWRLDGPGLTSDLTFSYLDPADIPGTTTEANFVLTKFNGVFTTPGGTVDTTANTATITGASPLKSVTASGVSTASDWTLAEPGALLDPGDLAFSSPTYAIGEAGGTATITVNRTNGSDGAVTVDYATVAGGTATGGASCAAGIDYVSVSGRATFAAGSTTPQTFDISICQDMSVEGNETVNLALTNPLGGATIGTPSTAVLTIIEDDVPLSGTIDVPGPQFTSLTNVGGLFEAINNLGASGPLTIRITNNLPGETGTVALNEIAGGHAVVIRPFFGSPTIGAPNFLISGSNSAGLIRINGADNVTIDGSSTGGTAGDLVGGDPALRNLTIQNTSPTATAGAVIVVSTGTGGAQNTTIKNINVLGQDPTQTFIGIAFGGATAGSVGANDNARVENCAIRRATIGLYNAGASGDQSAGGVVTKNDMTGTGAERIRRAGMLLFFNDNLTVSLNSIGGISSDEAIDVLGIGFGSQLISATTTSSGGITNSTLTRNRISGVASTNGLGLSAAGITVAGGSTGSNIVSNNMISGVTAPATSPDIVAGIFVVGATGSDSRLYHNSVSLTGDRGATANQIGSYGIAITGVSPVVELKNNIFYNTQTSGGGANARTYSIGMVASVFTNFNSNFNDFFASGANASFFRTGSLASTGGTQYATLAAFSAATSSDANSQEVDPLFINNATDLHLQPLSPVGNDGTPIAAVTVDFDGEARSATTPDIGADEILTPALPGSLQFSSPTYVGDEDSSPFVVTVTRTGGTNGAVSVNYSASGGTATGGASCTAGIDYVTTSGTLNFADGVSSQTFNVTICNDVFAESDETINYALTNPTGGATIGTPSSAVQTIIDDDPAAGSISISDARIFEGKAGLSIATFTVTHTGSGFASVDYTTVNGTAIAGSDYITTTATLVFNAPTIGESGIPTQQISVFVPVSGDLTREANETYFVILSNAVNSTIADNRGAGIIVDDDRQYTTDFDDDRISDFSVYRPSENRWYVRNSSNGTATVLSMGAAGDLPVPGDYNADGATDFALWRPSTGEWFVRLSGTPVTQTTVWGTVGDKPAQGDYDGDGRTDLAIYRPSTGQWWVRRSSNGTSFVVSFGISTDEPVQSDFDGDFKTDIAVYRGGVWYILQSSNGSVRIQNWGLASDRPLAGDFDGDGSSDLAIYRNGDWWIFRSLTGTATSLPWGISTDIPAPADFDGDGSTDIVVFRPSSGDWYVRRSSNNTTDGLNWGLAGDIPVPSRIIYDDSLSPLQ